MRRYLPNRLPFGRLALVALRGGQPVRGAFQRISATQIVGGRSWSLSLIRVKPHEVERNT